MINGYRLGHSVGVARKMMEIGAKRWLPEDQLRELFVLGFNHDIGYEFGEPEVHGVLGAKVLKDSGYKYWKEILLMEELRFVILIRQSCLF